MKPTYKPETKIVAEKQGPSATPTPITAEMRTYRTFAKPVSSAGSPSYLSYLSYLSGRLKPSAPNPNVLECSCKACSSYSTPKCGRPPMPRYAYYSGHHDNPANAYDRVASRYAELQSFAATVEILGTIKSPVASVGPTLYDGLTQDQCLARYEALQRDEPGTPLLTTMQKEIARTTWSQRVKASARPCDRPKESVSSCSSDRDSEQACPSDLRSASRTTARRP
jgi:hypothetical protein